LKKSFLCALYGFAEGEILGIIVIEVSNSNNSTTSPKMLCRLNGIIGINGEVGVEYLAGG
jgi:hypothetical protein